MTKLVFATNNKNKFTEIKNKVRGHIELLSLSDIGFYDKIPETRDTIEGNALEKAWYIFNKFKLNCFADDTGLEVDALNGAPGVYSARYAGEDVTYLDNVNKLLVELKGKPQRSARFKTCIALIMDGKEFLFNGEVQGGITTEMHGDNGFGYDPVFKPNGHEKTFAEMTMELKNKISHRTLAIQKLVECLNSKFS